jgi:DNA-directed RNA polymerase specialized sigma24 family protein
MDRTPTCASGPVLLRQLALQGDRTMATLEENVMRELDWLAAIVANDLKLPHDAAEDLRQETALRLLRCLRKDSRLQITLLERPKLLSYLRRSLRSVFFSNLRRNRLRLTQPLEDTLALPAGEDSGSDDLSYEDARTIISKIYGEVGDHGRFVLDVACGWQTFEHYMRQNEVTRKTASVHFARGASYVRFATQRLLQQYGEDTTDVLQNAIRRIRFG